MITGWPKAIASYSGSPSPSQRAGATQTSQRGELAQVLGGRLVAEPQLDPLVALGGLGSAARTCLRSTCALTTSRRRGSLVASNASSTGSSGLRWPRKPPGKTIAHRVAVAAASARPSPTAISSG